MQADAAELSITPDYYEGPVSKSDAPPEIREAFENMRERGIVTLEGETCCSSCGAFDAGSRLSELVEEERDDGLVGYCVFNEQSVGRGGYQDIYLSYGGSCADKEFMPDAGVAGIVIECLDRAGVPWEWGGSSNTCVLMNPSDD